MGRLLMVKTKGRVRLGKTKKAKRPKMSKQCGSGDHNHCFVLKCTCKVCQH